MEFLLSPDKICKKVLGLYMWKSKKKLDGVYKISHTSAS